MQGGIGFNAPMMRLPMMPQMPQTQSFTPKLPVHVAPRFTPTFTPTHTNTQVHTPANVGRFFSSRNSVNTGAAMLRASSFTPMQEEALTTSLSTMKMPLTKENVTLAKAMVQTGVPLTKENMASLKTSLASLPNGGTAGDMKAASFLKSASLPQTPQNITTLSNFISVNPHIGACVFAFNGELRKLCDGKGKFNSSDKMKIISKTSSKLGEMMMEAGADIRQNARAFRKNAGNSGMNLPSFMMGNRDEELDSLMLELRKMLFSDKKSSVSEGLKKSFLELEDSISAQRLINSGKREGLENFFYMQIPLVIDDQNFTAEFKIFYTTDYEGRKIVDPENFEFELAVPTRYMDEVRFKGSVVSGVINITAGFASPEICMFAERFMPALMERLENNIGFVQGDWNIFEYLAEESNMAVSSDDFGVVESVDMSC